MTLVRQNIDSLKRAEDKLEEIAKDSIRDNMDYIMFLLKDDQIANSIKSDGSLMPYYAPNTIEYAKHKIPRTGVSSKSSNERYNLEWEGTWIDSLYLKIENDGFDILARDAKTAMLESLVGGKITALTKENNDQINDEIIKPALYKHLFHALLNF